MNITKIKARPIKDFYITNGGNILVINPTCSYFVKPNGQFIRQVTKEESNYLIQNCIKITPCIKDTLWDFPKMPVWNFIISIEIEQDYSNYKVATCNNGGDYSFMTHQDWFVCQFEDKYRFAYVEWKTTSAEFSYDELAGRFEQNLATILPINIGESRYYLTQTRSGYEEMEVLEAIQGFEESSLEELWLSECLYIPERNSEEKEYIYPALSLTQKKEILTRLKELGWNKSKKRSRRR